MCALIVIMVIDASWNVLIMASVTTAHATASDNLVSFFLDLSKLFKF